MPSVASADFCSAGNEPGKFLSSWPSIWMVFIATSNSKMSVASSSSGSGQEEGPASAPDSLSASSALRNASRRKVEATRSE